MSSSVRFPTRAFCGQQGRGALRRTAPQLEERLLWDLLGALGMAPADDDTKQADQTGATNAALAKSASTAGEGAS